MVVEPSGSHLLVQEDGKPAVVVWDAAELIKLLQDSVHSELHAGRPGEHPDAPRYGIRCCFPGNFEANSDPRWVVSVESPGEPGRPSVAVTEGRSSAEFVGCVHADCLQGVFQGALLEAHEVAQVLGLGPPIPPARTIVWRPDLPALIPYNDLLPGTHRAPRAERPPDPRL